MNLSSAPRAHLPRSGRLHELVERADRLAFERAQEPLRTLLSLLLVNLVAAACFAAFGLYVIGDQAELFREYNIGTVLSFAELLFIAVVARAIHRLEAPGRRFTASFWGIAAAAFLVFAFDEITQSAIFISHFLEDTFALGPAGSFHDLEAVLLTLLFGSVAVVLLPRLGDLLRHPRALLVLGMAAALGAASQGLDSFAPATRWEFVAEETLKLSAEAFFIGGFLLALGEVVRRRDPAEPAG